MTITLDSTQHSTVVLCSDCPWWFGFADTTEEGWRVGRGHELRAHPGARQVSSTIANTATRRAAGIARKRK